MVKSIDEKQIPTVYKTNDSMMFLKIQWTCPNCGGPAEIDLVTLHQADQPTKNFVANFCERRWCEQCYVNNNTKILTEVKVLFLPEKDFVRWARGWRKTPKSECVSEE